MKELKVGERITITLEAVEEKNCLPCEECFFASFGNGCIVKDVLACNFLERSDGKNIIFKEVKKYGKEKNVNLKDSPIMTAMVVVLMNLQRVVQFVLIGKNKTYDKRRN